VVILVRHTPPRLRGITDFALPIALMTVVAEPEESRSSQIVRDSCAHECMLTCGSWTG